MQSLFDDRELKVFEPNYVFIDSNEKLLEYKDAITAINPVALDTEAQGLDYFKDELLLLQLSDDRLSYVLDVRPGKADMRLLQDYLEDPKVVKIGHNLQFDYCMIKVQRDIELANMFCLMMAEQVITAGLDPSMSYKLEAVCRRRLGIQLNKKVVNTFIGYPLHLPFTKKQLDYAASDTLVLHEIFYQQLKAIEKHALQKTISLEMSCLGPLADTIIHGCNIDYDSWNLILDHSKEIEIRLANDIREILSSVSEQTSLFGTPVINLNSQKQLIRYLNKLGIPVDDTKSDTLEDVADMHPVVHMILEYREFEKIRSSYGDKLLKKKKPKTSRIHPNFNQCRAATGRMSSSTPNFQQIHRPKPFHKKLFELKFEDVYYEDVRKIFRQYEDDGNPLPSMPREAKEGDYSDKYFKIGRIRSGPNYKKPNMDLYVDSTGTLYKYIPDFRECFVAPKGYKIVDADFSQCVYDEELVSFPGGVLPLNRIITNSIVTNTSNQDYGRASDGTVLKYKSKGDKECVVVRDEMGRETISTVDHKFLVCTGFKEYSWKEAKDLVVGDWLVSAKDWITYSTWDDLDVLRAELAGMWVGDGSYSSGGVQIAKGEDEDVWEYLNNLCVKLFSKSLKNYANTNSWDLIGLSIKEEMKDSWGLNKPSALEASFPLRFMASGHDAIGAMLRGYFEADGTVNATKKLCVVYSTTYSKKLAQQTQLLLLGLGIQSKIFSRRETTNFGSGVCYRVQIRGFEDLTKFRQKVGFISYRKSQSLNKVISLASVKNKTSVDVIPFLSEKMVEWYNLNNLQNNAFYVEHIKNLVGGKLPHRPRRYAEKFVVDCLKENATKGIEILTDIDDLVHKSCKLCFARVESIQNCGILPVADIAVQGSPSFVAGGHVVHNCELRILAALSNDPKMLKIYKEDGDIHTETAREIFGKDDKESRDNAKPINFGIAYGQTSWGLSRLIGKPESYCREVLQKVKERFPVRANWLEKTGEVAFEKGYSRTPIGRIRWLPMLIDPIKFPEEAERFEQALKRRGTNHEIQGTNADVTKLALINLSRAFREENLDAHVMIVVHDEFVIEAREDHADRVARLAEEHMAKAFNRIIPNIAMPCEAHIADYWSK